MDRFPSLPRMQNDDLNSDFRGDFEMADQVENILFPLNLIRVGHVGADIGMGLEQTHPQPFRRFPGMPDFIIRIR